jgi:hypothetical protein
MFSPLRSNLWVHRVVPRVLATRNPSTFGAPGRGLWCDFFQICFDMADANARLERLRRRNAVQGQTEPIFRRLEASAGEEEEEDLESSYLLSGRTEPSLSFTATSTSRARSGSQMSPAQALAMAQELLCYQPTDDGREGWRARTAELVAIANEDPA